MSTKVRYGEIIWLTTAECALLAAAVETLHEILVLCYSPVLITLMCEGSIFSVKSWFWCYTVVVKPGGHFLNRISD